MATRKTATKKTTVQKPTTIRAFSLMTANLDTLDVFAQDASDLLGWRVSSSAIVRALIRHADRRGAAWLRENILPLLEDEIAGCTVWGTKK